MEIGIREYKNVADLKLETDKLYLIFGFGTGDTFNAMIHLCKAPPTVDYELIIKKPQLNLVIFLIKLFSRIPRVIHVIDHWNHDFSNVIKAAFPSVGFFRGFQGNLDMRGLVDVWHNPFNYNKIIPLSDIDIDAICAYFSSENPKETLPDNSVIFFPTAGENFKDYLPPWGALADELRAAGHENIFVNVSGVPNYGSENIPGVVPLSLSHEELIRSIYGKKGKVKLIGVRSGVLDILRFSKARALVLYQPVPSGIFETCRFGLLRHNLDIIEAICLNKSSAHQDDVLKFYIKHFTASPLEL